LIKGFGLTVSEARPILTEWNAQCEPPWSAGEIEHKLNDADEKPDDKPRGFLFVAGQQDRPQNLAKIYGAALNGNGVYGPNGGINANGINGTNGTIPTTNLTVRPPVEHTYAIGAEDDPNRLARLFVDTYYNHHDGMALRFWREEFLAWDDSHYSPVPRKEIAAEINRSIEFEFQRIYDQAMMLYAMKRQRGAGGDGASGDGGSGGQGGKETGPPKKRGVSTRLVADVTQALSNIALLKVRVCPDQPAWIEKPTAHPWAAEEVLPTRNALIHLPSYIDGKVYMRPPTPLFFASYSLDYPFDPESPEPAEWFRFLDQLWPDDPDSIRTLQEWMGHLLTPDTSQQKIMMLIGPKRSGKGTIVRVIRSLIGSANVVNPTLSSLATNFGLAPLLGKPAAIITDARISGRTDTAVVIERLLSISGEDAQTIDRKHRDVITTKLPTRFMIVSNELPKVKDASGALAGRMLFLQLTRSFYGHEDTGLLDRLLPELPGILLWAIRGWANLRDRGHFIQPAAGVELVTTMEDLSSPTRAFMRDCCREGDGDEFVVQTATIYQAWRTWCSAKGQDAVGTEEEFGRNLRAVLPGLKKTHPRIDGRPTWHYVGLRLLNDWETNEEDEECVIEVVRESKVPF
jgi:putative DNA primase/helicase